MTVPSSDLKIVSRLNLVNPSDSEITFVLEPWGESYSMPAGAVFRVVAEGPDGEDPEVAFQDGSIVVWAWPGSTVRLFQGDFEFGGTPRGRRPMPLTAATAPVRDVHQVIQA